MLFNRFYQPDIDIDSMRVVNVPQLSDSSELLLRLRWLAILAGNTSGTLAAGGGRGGRNAPRRMRSRKRHYGTSIGTRRRPRP